MEPEYRLQSLALTEPKPVCSVLSYQEPQSCTLVLIAVIPPSWQENKQLQSLRYHRQQLSSPPESLGISWFVDLVRSEHFSTPV